MEHEEGRKDNGKNKNIVKQKGFSSFWLPKHV